MDIKSDSIETTLQRRIFDMQESEVAHNPYEHETRKLYCIETGDAERFIDCQYERWSGKIGIVADNPLRQEKNIAIIVITLASRAAIRGGLSSELAMSMADNYIYAIEKINDTSAVISALFEYERNFVYAVRELKKENYKNKYVEKAKDYIYKHLHSKIELSELSEYIGISRDHLCRLFKKQEGMTLKEYVIVQKINQAKELLIYTDYSIELISNHLEFSSQSQFTLMFRKRTGMTPTAYRNAYIVI